MHVCNVRCCLRLFRKFLGHHKKMTYYVALITLLLIAMCLSLDTYSGDVVATTNEPSTLSSPTTTVKAANQITNGQTVKKRKTKAIRMPTIVTGTDKIRSDVMSEQISDQRESLLRKAAEAIQFGVDNRNSIQRNIKKGRTAMIPNLCESPHEFKSCLRSCWRYEGCMEKTDVNCSVQCKQACFRLDQVPKCKARVVADIFQRRQVIYANQFLEDSHKEAAREEESKKGKQPVKQKEEDPVKSVDLNHLAPVSLFPLLQSAVKG